MNTKIRLMFMVLLLAAMYVHGETIDGDSIKLGTKPIPFSEEYGVWTIPENSKKYVCFSINQPADIRLIVSMNSGNASKPLAMLFTSQMQMLCSNYDSNSSTESNKTITIKNVPAGDYKLFIDAQNFSTLMIEGTEPDIVNTAANLGEYSNSFEVSRSCCPGSIYDTFHGNGIANGLFAYRFHITEAMDFYAANVGSSTVNTSVLYLTDEKMSLLC